MSAPPDRPPAPAPGDSEKGKGADKGKSSSLASNLFSGAGMLQDLTAGLSATQKAPSAPGTSSQAWEGAQVYSAPSGSGTAHASSAGTGQAFRSNVPVASNGDEAYGAFAAPASASAGLAPNNLAPGFGVGRESTQAGWDQAWAGSTVMHPASSQKAEDRDGDFLALLEAEEQALGPVPQGQSSVVDAAAPAPGESLHVPSAFLTREIGLGRQNIAPAGYAPPEPGVDTISAEQVQMHLALDALQHSDRPDRVAERIVPPADNEALRQGVYARTEEEALREIIGGQAQVQQLNSQLESQARTAPQTQTRAAGQAQVSQWDQLRTYLPRGTYVDEVYNLPPLLARTLAEAEAKPQNEEDEDKRRKAIRRLDTLRKHLEPVQPGPPAPVDVWDMEKILQELDRTGQ